MKYDISLLDYMKERFDSLEKSRLEERGRREKRDEAVQAELVSIRKGMSSFAQFKTESKTSIRNIKYLVWLILSTLAVYGAFALIPKI